MEELKSITQFGRISAKANEILTPELSAKIGATHGTYLGNKGILVVARDYFNNSRMLKRAYIAGCMSAGIDILNLHSAPLPLVQFCIRRFGASGGTYFSSGATFEQDTQIRFYDSSGVEFTTQNVESLNEIFRNNKIIRSKANNIGTITSILQTFDIYKKAIPNQVDRKKIQNCDLKVVLDCSFGPMGEIAPEVLNILNIEVIGLNTYYRPLSNRVYPELKSVRDSAAIIKSANANLGFIFDPDGTRILILDETGNIVDFEDIFMLFISNDKGIKKSKANPIFTTYSCSKILDDYAKNLGYSLKRVENMPGVISRKIRMERGAFGASDTNKFYFPQYGPFSDGLLNALKILEIIAEKDEPLSSLIRNFPKTLKVSKTLNVSPYLLENYDKIIKAKLKDKNVLIMDIMLGIKIVYDKYLWVQIRPSLYRDSLIFTSEGPDTKSCEELIRDIEKILKEENSKSSENKQK
ncbi:MAG: hypothetical protein ACTSRZ_06755 [Promethearchaeota archaeon]